MGDGGVAMSSMWVGGFVPTILAMIVTPTLILTLIVILGAILESRYCVSHLAVCHFWVLPIWPPTATISVASIQQVAITQSIISIEISCRLQVLTMLLALLFGPEKYCGGGSQGGYLIDNY